MKNISQTYLQCQNQKKPYRSQNALYLFVVDKSAKVIEYNLNFLPWNLNVLNSTINEKVYKSLRSKSCSIKANEWKISNHWNKINRAYEPIRVRYFCIKIAERSFPFLRWLYSTFDPPDYLCLSVNNAALAEILGSNLEIVTQIYNLMPYQTIILMQNLSKL